MSFEHSVIEVHGPLALEVQPRHNKLTKLQ
jgi:hypothetical protein